jgi:hypothetical protein
MSLSRRALFIASLFCAVSFSRFLLPAFSQQADSSVPNPTHNSGAGQSQSLGDVARKLRKDTTTEVKMTDADTKKLFESVDKIFAFAAEDTGMPKHAPIKRQLVGKADVEKYTSGRLAKEEFTQRFATSESSMKKLGFLPRDFNLREFLVKSNGQNVAGYYDEETRTISLLNWVSPDQQGPILAHELTHALQDQNYDLTKWMKAAAKPTDGASKNNDTDDGAIARKAVIEGQAMVVYVDYMLAAVGRNLEDTPGLLYQMEEPAVKAVIDSQLMHDAPMIMREMGIFSYNEGLIFEGELLHKGGKKMAFAGVFARPPRNSHEVLQPEAYISGVKVPPVRIPDMRQVLSNQYEVYDSGGIGELDVRALLKQYGERKIAAELSSAWQGGAYVTYRRATKATAEISPALSDLAFLYVSRWKSPQAAERFARFYASAVSQRYRSATAQASPACTGADCPLSTVQIATEEGPVIVEHWADNSVVVSESFDQTTAAKLRDAVRDGTAAVHADNLRNDNSSEDELGSRLYEIPAFRRFQASIGERIAKGMTSSPPR